MDISNNYNNIPTINVDPKNYYDFNTQDTLSYTYQINLCDFNTFTRGNVFIIIEFNSDRSKFRVIGVYINVQFIPDEYKDFTKYQILPVTRYYYYQIKYQVTLTENTNQLPLSNESDWVDITELNLTNNDDFDITLIYNTKTNLFECQYDKDISIPDNYNVKPYKKITTHFLDSYNDWNDDIEENNDDSDRWCISEIDNNDIVCGSKSYVISSDQLNIISESSQCQLPTTYRGGGLQKNKLG